MKKKALVLGGKTGLLGQALVEVLTEAGWNVSSAGRESFNALGHGVEGELRRLLEREKPQYLFNTIAYTQVDQAEENYHDAELLNVSFPGILGRIIKEHPCHLVHFSTDFVFNGKKIEGYVTEDIPDPLNVYGATKLAGEKALLALELPFCTIIRTAWLFGSGRGNFVRTILTKGKEKGVLNVVDDQRGSPTYTVDLARYTLALIEAEACGIFHVVNSGHASWCELAEEAVRQAEVECRIYPVHSKDYPQKALRPASSVLDTKKLTRVTGIVPRPWPQALREYIFRDFNPLS